jgi:hypothetical protein
MVNGKNSLEKSSSYVVRWEIFSKRRLQPCPVQPVQESLLHTKVFMGKRNFPGEKQDEVGLASPAVPSQRVLHIGHILKPKKN